MTQSPCEDNSLIVKAEFIRKGIRVRCLSWVEQNHNCACASKTCRLAALQRIGATSLRCSCGISLCEITSAAGFPSKSLVVVVCMDGNRRGKNRPRLVGSAPFNVVCAETLGCFSFFVHLDKLQNEKYEWILVHELFRLEMIRLQCLPFYQRRGQSIRSPRSLI